MELPKQRPIERISKRVQGAGRWDPVYCIKCYNSAVKPCTILPCTHTVWQL